VINILSLPDQFHRRTFGIALVNSVRPAFAAGEPVVVEYDGTEGERLIEKIGHLVVPTSPPWVVFADVAGSAGGSNMRWDTEAMGGTTVIQDAGLVFETDMFMGNIAGLTEGAPLTATAEHDTAGVLYGYWRLAVSTEHVYATVEVAPLATPALGGVLTVRFGYAPILV
jgi:hypothetical protein